MMHKNRSVIKSIQGIMESDTFMDTLNSKINHATGNVPEDTTVLAISELQYLEGINFEIHYILIET